MTHQFDSDMPGVSPPPTHTHIHNWVWLLVLLKYEDRLSSKACIIHIHNIMLLPNTHPSTPFIFFIYICTLPVCTSDAGCLLGTEALKP